MATREVVTLNETKAATPGVQAIEAPQTGDTYSMPRPVSIAGVAGTSPLTITDATQTTSKPVLDLSQTWNNAAVTFTGLKFNVTDTTSAAASLLMDLQVGGASKFQVTKGGVLWFGNTVTGLGNIDSSYGVLIRQSTTEIANFSYNGITVAASYPVAWVPSTDTINGTADVKLYRDAANTLALRNSTTAQTFNIYNTYTDASNYERGFMRWATNVLEIGAEAAGTGTARVIRFPSSVGSTLSWEFKSLTGTLPTLKITGTDRSVTIDPGNGNMLAVSSGGFQSRLDYVAGASANHAVYSQNGNGTTIYFGLAGSAAGVMQLNNAVGKGSGYGAAAEMWEMTAPAAPAANGVRIYAQDNGAGKTQLMALFASGAAQQIAIEP